jgi:hypothetical protein
MTVGSWIALQNEKLVILPAKGNYVAVDRAFLLRCMRAAIADIYVDEAWYMDANADVAEAVRQGVLSSAKEHFALYGYLENRQPYSIAVEEEWYLEQYPDVRDAVAAGVFSSAQEHFDFAGYKEGRHPFPAFRLRAAN